MGGRSIRIFLVDGTTTGLRTAEIGLSTCKALLAQRGDLASLARREESRKSGVYVLLGEDPDLPGRTAVYVGEGDVVLDRISGHDRDEEKEFWERVVVFVSKDLNLTKAHCRYLEARLIQIAREAKKATLKNRTTPDAYPLPEADGAEMEEMLAQMLLLLGTFGISAFDRVDTAARRPPHHDETGSDLTWLYQGDGYQAKLRIIDGEYVVLKGSLGRTREVPSFSKSSSAARRALVAACVLAERDGQFVFTQDYAFGSPSGAAAAVSGISVNGRRAWHLEDGRTLAEVEDEELASGAAAAPAQEAENLKNS